LLRLLLEYFNKKKKKARQIVESIIEAEQTYLFTNDVDYLTNRTNLIPKTGEPSKVISDSKNVFVMELRNRIDTFFKIVVRNMRDSIPKAIGHFLVRGAQDNMQFSLYEEINKSEEVMNLLSEPAHVTMERDTLTKTLDVLNKARKAIGKDPDLASTMRIEDIMDDPEVKKKSLV